MASLTSQQSDHQRGLASRQGTRRSGLGFRLAARLARRLGDGSRIDADYRCVPSSGLSDVSGAASKFIQHRDWKQDWHWPVGKRRMEPVSIVVFSTVMIASFVQGALPCLPSLLTRQSSSSQSSAVPSRTCKSSRSRRGRSGSWPQQSSSRESSGSGAGSSRTPALPVRRSLAGILTRPALAQDAENDVVFNIFSLIFPLVGQYINWPYLDPIGGVR